MLPAGVSPVPAPVQILIIAEAFMEFWLASAHVPGTAAKAAVRAQEEGFDGISFGDTQCIAADPYVGLTVAGLAAPRIGLAVGVTNPVTRHPAVTACAIASVQLASEGRAVLGIGRGDSAVSKLDLRAAPVAAFERYLHDLQSYLSGRQVEHEGCASTLEWLAGCSMPKVPVDVAATGPAMIEIGARHAERLTFNLGASKERIAQAIAAARQARRDQGLPSDGLSLGAYFTVAPHSDIRSARNMVKAVTAVYARFQHMGGDELKQLGSRDASVVRAISENYDMSRHGQANARHVVKLSDEFIDDFAVVGTAEQCAEKLAGLIALGLDRLVMVGPNNTVPAADFAEARDLLSRKVLPELRR